MAPKRVWRRASAPEEKLAMSQADVRLAYQLIDCMNPFPRDVVRRNSPLAWKVSEALGRATSVDASCVYVHLLLAESKTLNALMVKYGGILGKYANMIMIQHGAPGDSKSVILCCLK